jgi:hypothetical protein
MVIPIGKGNVTYRLPCRCDKPDLCDDGFCRNCRCYADMHTQPMVVAQVQKELEHFFEFFMSKPAHETRRLSTRSLDRLGYVMRGR